MPHIPVRRCILWQCKSRFIATLQTDGLSMCVGFLYLWHIMYVYVSVYNYHLNNICFYFFWLLYLHLSVSCKPYSDNHKHSKHYFLSYLVSLLASAAQTLKCTVNVQAVTLKLCKYVTNNWEERNSCHCTILQIILSLLRSLLNTEAMFGLNEPRKRSLQNGNIIFLRVL